RSALRMSSSVIAGERAPPAPTRSLVTTLSASERRSSDWYQQSRHWSRRCARWHVSALPLRRVARYEVANSLDHSRDLIALDGIEASVRGFASLPVPADEDLPPRLGDGARLDQLLPERLERLGLAAGADERDLVLRRELAHVFVEDAAGDDCSGTDV